MTLRMFSIKTENEFSLSLNLKRQLNKNEKFSVIYFPFMGKLKKFSMFFLLEISVNLIRIVLDLQLGSSERVCVVNWNYHRRFHLKVRKLVTDCNTKRLILLFTHLDIINQYYYKPLITHKIVTPKTLITKTEERKKLKR